MVLIETLITPHLSIASYHGLSGKLLVALGGLILCQISSASWASSVIYSRVPFLIPAVKGVCLFDLSSLCFSQEQSEKISFLPHLELFPQVGIYTGKNEVQGLLEKASGAWFL